MNRESIFFTGWRPFIGWVTSLSLGFYFIVSPIIALYTGGNFHTGLEGTDILSLVSLALGTYGVRGYEKIEEKKIRRKE